MTDHGGPRGLDRASEGDKTRDLGGTDWDTGARRLGGNMGGGRTLDRTGSSKQLDRTSRGVSSRTGPGSLDHESISQWSAPGSRMDRTGYAHSGKSLVTSSGLRKDMVAGSSSIAGVGSSTGSVEGTGFFSWSVAGIPTPQSPSMTLHRQACFGPLIEASAIKHTVGVVQVMSSEPGRENLTCDPRGNVPPDPGGRGALLISSYMFFFSFLVVRVGYSVTLWL